MKILLFLQALALCSSRSVNWYTNTNIAGNTAFLASHGDVISGAYLCCNVASFSANGTFLLSGSPAQVASEVSVFTSASKEAWLVGGVSVAAIASGSWAAGLAAAAAASQPLLAAGLMGILFDYEPAANYTQAHAEAYGQFLEAVSTAISPLRVGMDIADWGILGPSFWQHYESRGVSRFTSMTPTYYATSVAQSEKFVPQALAALPPGSYAAGIGSVLAPDASPCKWDYKWTNDTLRPFVDFLAASSVEFIDVWRCDIDSPYDTKGPDTTAPFFMEALQHFLAP